MKDTVDEQNQTDVYSVIYRNPYDLQFVLIYTDGKYGVMINRGLAGDYRPILNIVAEFGRGEALAATRRVLEVAASEADKTGADPATLNHEHIELILKELDERAMYFTHP